LGPAGGALYSPNPQPNPTWNSDTSLTDTSGTGPTNGITTDLVGYVIITLPDVDALVTLTPALGELVESGTLRILDFVVVVRDDTPRVLELDALDQVADLQRIRPHMPGLLTQRDITLASVAIPEGAAGVVLVVEDRWAKPLSVAASLAGGQIVAGERISAERIQAAMADDSPD
jgi:Family of unknown function (DUF6325)